MTKFDILGIKDRRTVPVEVPEWSATVHIVGFSGKVRDELDRKFLACTKEGKVTDPSGIKSLAIVRSLCDESGTVLLSDADIPALEEKDAVALNRIWEAIEALNYLSDKTSDAKKN